MGCCCSKDKETTPSQTRKRYKYKTLRSFFGLSGSDNPRYYVALWNYTKSSNAELSFEKGVVFKEVSDQSDTGPEWIFVTQEQAEGACSIRITKSGGRQSVVLGTGYIPRIFVAIRGSLEAESYWFGDISRDDAATLLKGKPLGMYLVRSRTGGEFLPEYALSVSCKGKVKHFKIHSNQKPKSPIYSMCGRKAPDIQKLIPLFSSEMSKSLGCLLKESPPRPPPVKPCISAEIEKHWQEIPRSQIGLQCEIGKGFYGVVHRGTWEPAPGVKLQVAVKELKTGATEGRANFLSEAVALKNLRHDRLVKLLGVVSANEPFYIITEFVKDGSLQSYLARKARETHFLEEAQLVAISCQIADGMRYLEEKKAVHRDLAARNVLIEEMANKSPENLPHLKQFDVKIADFGLAHMIKSGTDMQEKKALNLAIRWMAPETFKGKFSSASDVWSFGIVLYEIFTHGGDPYQGMTTQEVRKYVIEERKRLDRPPTMPDGIYNNLFCSCCEFRHQDRPSFHHIYFYLESYYQNKDPYYESYDKSPTLKRDTKS